MKKQDTSNYCEKPNAEPKAMIALHKEGIDMAKEKASDCPPQKRQPLKNNLKASLVTTAIGEVIKQAIQTGWAWAIAHVLDLINKFRQ